MTGAIAPLTDFSGWATGDLLVIVLLVLGAILLTRLAIWVRGLVIAQIDAHAIESDELVRSEAAKHRQVVAQVVTWAVLAVIYVVTAVMVVQRLGVPLAGLVAPAALLSAALGFGLQRFVQDIAAGFFITGERQYGFGDVVRIEATGVSEPATGTVEDVTLRVTRLRSVSGEVITTPNGQIVQVTDTITGSPVGARQRTLACAMARGGGMALIVRRGIAGVPGSAAAPGLSESGLWFKCRLVMRPPAG